MKQRIVFLLTVDVDSIVNFPSDWVKVKTGMPKEAGKVVKSDLAILNRIELNDDFEPKLSIVK